MPALVGSLLVQSANPLAVFFFARNIAFPAICMQNLPSAPLEAQPGQNLGLIVGNWGDQLPAS